VSNPVLDPLAPLEVLALLQLRKKLVMEQKDLSSYVPAARALLLCLVDALTRAESDERATQIRQAVKALTFNLAADTWPGWDEGLEITDQMMVLGIGAARLHMEMVEQLGEGDAARSNSHWLSGAHHLARKEYSEARAEFARGRDLAESEGVSLLNQGYQHLTDVLESPPNAAAASALARVKARLSSHAEADVFVGQLESAERVFSKL
jgi:hypothetical protein